MKLLLVVGARPNFMKVAPIFEAIKRHNEKISTTCGDDAGLGEAICPVLVHTGQHYDELMSDAFFRDLSLPKPDVHLGVGSGSHAVQTAEIMRKFEQVLLEEKPDIVGVVGDVNSTLACALVTAKISFDSAGSRPLIAHVEAGLRSFDHSMPEEINRLLTDHLSDLLFVTEESGLRNLTCEGISPQKIHFVGNTMIDALLALRSKANGSTILEELGLWSGIGTNGMDSSIRPYALLTLHRPANVDDRDTFLNILDGLAELAGEYPIIFPVHPRTRQRIKEFDFEPRMRGTRINDDPRCSRNGRHGIILTEPMGYLNFLYLMEHASLVVTDSGGIQEETTILGTPCVTVRENTERPVTVESGTNAIAGTTTHTIKEAIRCQIVRQRKACAPKNWDGHAATRIVDILVRCHCEKRSARPYHWHGLGEWPGRPSSTNTTGGMKYASDNV
jgi:UDP-N-acetylglucosamine 2-epimerase (non-hydrolysing)